MKVFALFFLAIVLMVSCKKYDDPTQATEPQTATLIIGKWSFNSVTTVYRDSTGTERGSHTYTNDPQAYFQFNQNGMWLESLLPDSLLSGVESGIYEVNSDSTFTLKYPGINTDELNKIYFLTSHSFKFSHTRSTMFNGTIPGTVEYVFDMYK